MRSVESRTGLAMPVLGLGTWRMGEDRRRRKAEIAALRLGIDLGMRLIDTAEMYANGAAEELVALALEGRRDKVFLVSKVLPHNASRDGTMEAAERSLKRLRTDRIDLYLLHWPGRHPLEATYEAFGRLVEQGKILHYGVSNFDVDRMEQSEKIPQGTRIAANQVLYNLARRSIEHRLLPWCRRRGVTVMAYSPLEQGELRLAGALREVAARHGCTPYQVALAWTFRQPGVVAVAKASREQHLRENVAAAELRLTREDLDALDRAFPRAQSPDLQTL